MVAPRHTVPALSFRATGQGPAHPCVLVPALPRLGEKPQHPVGESQHVSRPGGEPRQAEWVSRAHSCPRGLCPLQPAGPWPGPIRSGWTAPVPAQPRDGGGARAQSMTVLNWDLRPASAALLLCPHQPLSVPLRGLGGKTVVGKWAGAHSSLSQTKWPAGSRPAGSSCVDSFSGSGRNSECVLPPPLTEPSGCGSLGLRGGCP